MYIVACIIKTYRYALKFMFDLERHTKKWNCSVDSSSHTSHAAQQIYGLCLVFFYDRAFGRLPLYSTKKPELITRYFPVVKM